VSSQIYLGIETSCDDTSIALLKSNENKDVTVLSLNSYSQDFILQKWGGVVPELAARSHVKAIPPLLEMTLKDSQLSVEDIGHIAVTTNPGLIGSLLTGINLAKTLSLFLELPITPVNHLFAHLEAIHLTDKVQYPYLGLLVSGGHSAFFLVKGPNDFTTLGTTLDDAAGEAFDKGGKILGVGYPAGKIIDEFSTKGNRLAFKFPISYMRDRPGKMSFSGLKTALRVQLSKMSDEDKSAHLLDLCASYQEAIVQTLKIKTHEIIEEILKTKVRNFQLPIVIGGGVACNSRLREVFTKEFPHTYFVAAKYCTDNAAMVANWASRVQSLEIPFPLCLELDAKSRFLEKK
jgi:N6-L-threonylcarbamoyladenine synthase